MQSTAITIRDADSTDVTACHDLYASCFEKPWSKASWRNILGSNGYVTQLAFLNEQPAGLITAQILPDIWDILTLCTHVNFRHQGIARQLVASLKALAREKGVSTLQLEVRADNPSAIRLYLEASFDIVGNRKEYYPATSLKPAADALLMSTFLK